MYRVAPPRQDALEGKGPQRRPQERLDRRLAEVAKAVGGGYCRLRMPLKLALAIRGTVAGRRLGALEGRGGGYPPPPLFQCISAPPPPLPQGSSPHPPPPPLQPQGLWAEQGQQAHTEWVTPDRYARPIWQSPEP